MEESPRLAGLPGIECFAGAPSTAVGSGPLRIKLGKKSVGVYGPKGTNYHTEVLFMTRAIDSSSDWAALVGGTLR